MCCDNGTDFGGETAAAREQKRMVDVGAGRVIECNHSLSNK